MYSIRAHLPLTCCNIVANSSPIVKVGCSFFSVNGFTKSFVGGEGVNKGHIDATSSAINELLGDDGNVVVDVSTRKRPSILYVLQIYNVTIHYNNIK